MDNRCLATALFVKEVNDLYDSFIVVACYPDHGRLFHCLLTNTVRLMEYWSSAIENIRN